MAVLGLALWLFIDPSEEPAPAPAIEETDGLDVQTDQQPVVPRHTVSATLGDADSSLHYLTQAKTLQASGDYAGARQAAYQVLEATQDGRTADSARQLLSEIHTELAFSSRQMEEKQEYVIQSGDSLARIARKFNTTVELLQKGNNLKGSMIRQGDRLRILKGDFSVHVDKSDNLLDVFLNGKFFKRYRVGTGKFAKTPEGDFEINDRIAQPTWWRPDGKAIPFGNPENLLGTHWLSLNVRGYGIHGTWEPETIGHQASAGCVRLLNEDIEELFALLPLRTPVTITN
jgi:lipoprotein-anchoring transpeptidase ErfK/SrfK